MPGSTLCFALCLVAIGATGTVAAAELDAHLAALERHLASYGSNVHALVNKGGTCEAKFDSCSRIDLRLQQE